MTIRVLRTVGPAAGSVQVVPFHDYVTVVMAAEWGSSNPAEVLKAGAVAATEYAWFYAIVWRGGSAADGSCYDVVDSTVDQVYAPETHAPAASITAAVDATWGVTVQKNSGLFVTHYRAGANVACGANADGTNLYQVSATHCAQDGMTFDQILTLYYGPGVQIAGAASGSPSAVGLRFLAQPGAGTAGVAFAVQPVVAVVDAMGQTLTNDPSSGTLVSLAPAAPSAAVSITCAGGLSRTAVAGVATFDGCMLTGAAADVVLVASAAGLAPASTAPFTVLAPAPTLILQASATVLTWGQDLPLAVSLAPAGSEAAGGRTLQLQRSTDGIGWAPVTDLTTDANGQTTYVDRPSGNAFYRVAFAGAPDLAPSTSPAVRVFVRRQVRLRPDNGGDVRGVARGTTVAFSALVRPVPDSTVRGPVEYRLYQLVGRSWVVKRTWLVTPDATGTARLGVTFGSRGTWSVRVFARATPTNAISVLSAAQRYQVR